MNVFGGRSWLRTILGLMVAAVLLGSGLSSKHQQARADSADLIPLTDRWTPTSQLWQDPVSGALTLHAWSQPAQALSPDSPTGWAPLDLSLVESSSDGFSPDTAAAQVTFADGTDDSAPVATLAQNDTSLSVDLDSSSGVPAPTIDGNTASYSSVQPGVDASLTATPGGMEISYLIDSAADAPATLDVPLHLDGLTASIAIDGSLVLTDSSGTQVGGAAPAQMWGAATDPSTGEPTIEQTVPATLVDGVGGPVLELTPDPSFWSTPGLTFPVEIDPVVSLTLLLDTTVDSVHQSTNYGSSTALRSGLFTGGAIDRAYIGFDRTAIAGKHITDASLQLQETGAGSCNLTQVDIYSVTSASAPPLYWTNRPPLGTMYASGSTNDGCTGHPAATETFSGGGASGHSLKDLVQLWSNGTATPAMVGIKADDESTMNADKTFTSSDAGANGPMLSVTYHSDPDVPTNLSVTDAGLDPVILHATFSDADGVGGHVVYTIYDRLGNTVISGSGTAVANGQDSPYTVPPGTLYYDTIYSISAQAVSGIYHSASSAPITYYYGDGPAGTTADTGAPNFVVQCAYGYDLRDDPIANPGVPGASRDHNFFGNDRTTALSTTQLQEEAVVELGTAHETGTEVRFPLVAPYPASFFSIGDYVRIQGFETTTAFNGKWPVYDVATDHSWFSVQFSTGLADDAGGTAGEAERGEVGLSSASENLYEATFTVDGSVAFTPFQTVVVQGFQGPTFEGYNGTWIVDGVNTLAHTFSAKVNTSGLGTGGSGSAGAQGLTCGQLESFPTQTDPGALSYDTAAYWAPSVWTTDGAFAPPVRARVYYVGLPGGQLCTGMHRNCVIQIPEGAGIAGGNPDAADPRRTPMSSGRAGTSPTTSARCSTTPTTAPPSTDSTVGTSSTGRWPWSTSPGAARRWCRRRPETPPPSAWSIPTRTAGPTRPAATGTIPRRSPRSRCGPTSD